MLCPRRMPAVDPDLLEDAQWIDVLRKRKSDALFEFLRKVQEINRQIKLKEIKAEIAQMDREYDKSMMELFKREAK